MNQVTVYLPKLGESIVSATVVQWFKKVGDRVALDEALLEVSTDKVNSEIPSPVAGVVTKILAEPDQEIEVGGALALISLQADLKEVQPTLKKEEEEGDLERSVDKDFLSPAVLKLASEHRIPLSDLEKIPREISGGRLSKKDILRYVESKKSFVPPSLSETGSDAIKMNQMRKAIAENMVRSFYEAPHATLIHEVDITNILRYIEKEKDAFFSKQGAKLTITVFIALAIAKAIVKYPLINSTLKGDTIYLKHSVNLGIAVSVDQGVMVPVIRGAEKLDLITMAKRVFELAGKVRSHALSPDDVKDGTVTMTNFGMTGVLVGIPIIRFPEVAIVGVGAIKKRVVVKEDESLAIRSMLHLSLTFDHRVLDGIYGCEFLQAVEQELLQIV